MNNKPIIPIKENVLPSTDLIQIRDNNNLLSLSPIPNQNDLSGQVDENDSLAKATIGIGSGNTQLPSMYTTKELYEARRFPVYNPLKTESEFAYGQSNLDKATNGLLKGLNLAATTFAGSFGMLYGVAKSPFTGRLADIWDNEITRNLDEWNEKVDNEYLPNYYTDAEKNAEWYSTDNWFKTNFLFDKLIKNSGFAIGAMYSGNLANATLLKTGATLGKTLSATEAAQSFKLFTPVLRNTARAFSNAKNIEAATVLESRIKSIADLTTKSTELAKIAKQTSDIAKVSDAGRRSIIAAYSAAGEASFEALQTAKEFRNNLIEEYKKENNGLEPVGDELAKINQISESVGKTSFFGNMALLGATEYVQLPYLMGSSYKATKQAANSLIGKTDDLLLKEGKYISREPITNFGKLRQKAYGASKYIFDPKEATQEISQYALQVGTQNYFNKAFQGKDADAWVDGFLYGFVGKTEEGEDKGALVSKEGMESLILGGITGGLMQAKRNYQENKAIASNTQELIGVLNSTPSFKEAFKDRVNSVNRGVVLQQQLEDAIISGDKLEAVDLKSDLLYNYFSTRVKYGRFDLIANDLAEIKQESLTEEGLSALKEQGYANINDTPQSFQERITELQNSAKSIEELYNNLNLQYSGILKEDNTKKYSPQIIDKLTYAAFKISNYDSRIPQVSSSLLEKGISVDSIIKDIVKNNKPNKEATVNTLNQINELDSSIEVKDRLKSDLKDVIELSLRRKLFIDEYEAIKLNPENYQTTELQEEKLKSPTVELEDSTLLELGKEYPLKETLIKEGTSLQFAPKIKVLSKTLGGEYQVQLPTGKTTFLTPEQLSSYNIVTTEVTSPELKKAFDKAVNKVISKEKYKDLNIPENATIELINSLNNPGLINEIEVEYNKLSEEIVKQQEEERILKENLKKHQEELKRQQSIIEKKSGSVATNDPTKDIDSLEPEDKKKDFEKLFISSTSASEDWEANNLKPHVIRTNSFINNFKNLPNKSNIKTILVTKNQEKSLGLEGLVSLSMKGSGVSENEYTNIDNGLIAAVYIEQKGRDIYYIDQNGKILSKIGESIDLNSIVFSTMPTTSLTWSNGKPKYRQEQEEEAKEQSTRWRQKREQLFNLPEGKFEIYDFSISRGIPIINNSIDRFTVGDNLIPENKIPTQEGLIQIPTKGTLSHNGEILKFPNGRPVLQYEDTLQFLSNNNFTKKQANSIFAVIKALSDDILSKQKKGKIIDLNVEYITFLQNVLFWKEEKQTVSNQIFIDPTTFDVSLGETRYSIVNIENYKEEIIDKLQKVYNSVNDKTLKEGLAKKFTEFYLEGESLNKREWKNYQTYLLASIYPDGSKRDVSDIPLSTSVVKPSEAVPYNFKQKYITLQGVELPEVSVKPAKIEVKKEIEVSKIGQYELNKLNDYKLRSGDIVQFIPTIENGDISVTVEPNDVTKKLSENAELVNNTIIPNLTKLEFATENVPNEQLVTQFIAFQITASLKQETKKEIPPAKIAVKEPITEEVKVISPEKLTITETKKRKDLFSYRLVGRTNVLRITEEDLQNLKEWHSKNVPNLPYQIFENIFTTYTGERAWGIFEQGIAKFYKSSERGTEYHEIFEGIWKAFLTTEEQQALLDEFKSKKGTFTDRQSGKKIIYSDATDLQAKERIADDFADFRLGKLPVKSIGEKILRFFKNIIEFFKSFIQQPSKKKELFEAIEAGKFKEFTVPNWVKEDKISEYKKIGDLTEQEINDLVQDMTVLFGQIVFKNNYSIFNPEKLTGKEIFDQIKEIYLESKVIDNKNPSRITEQEFDKLIKRVKEFLSSSVLKISFGEEDDIVTTNDENSNNRDYAPEPFSTNWKKSSPYSIKFLLGILPETKPQNQENSNSLELPELKTSNLGGYKLFNFSRAFATLLDKLANTTKVDQMIKKLTDLVKSDSNYIRLFTRLGGNRDSSQIDFGKFDYHDWRLFINFYQTFSKQKPDTFIQSVENGEVNSVSADIFNIITNTKSSWINNIRQLAKTNDSLIKYNKSTKTYQVENLSKIEIKKPDQQIDFLNKIGIPFTKEVYSKLKTQQRKTFSDSVSGIYTYLGSNKDILSITGNTLGVGGQFTTLAELYVKTTNPNQEVSRLGLDDKRRQNYAENNTLSVFENLFNSSENLDELLENRPELNDIFSQNSQTLKKGGLFFNEEGERIRKIKVAYIEGTENKDTNKDIITSSLSLGDRFTQEINQNINGRYYVLVPADSATEWMMDMGNSIEYSDIQTGNAWNKIYNIFKGYLKDDINLALDYTNRSSLKNVGKKAKELRVFKEILHKEQLDKLNKLIESEATEEEIDTFINDNISDINASVKDFIQEVVKQNLEILQNTNQVTQLGEIYSYPTLDENFVKNNQINKRELSENQINNILTFINTNYVINNIEFHKILFGDPYQFKIKEGQLDETKRIKSFLSPRRTTFDTPELNTFLNQEFNKVENIDLKESDLGYHQHKSFARTVTLADIELEGRLLGKTNEADAASWIMDNAYREVKIKNGQWSDEAEKWHQWQMAYTRQNAPFYKYTNDKLELQDIKILSEPEPKFVTEILKPIVSGVKNDKTNIELVLDKFSQMPVYYKAIQGTNLENLYEKMWKENVDYVIMESGRKVGIQKLHNLYNEDGSFNTQSFSTDTIVDVPWSTYGIQVENAYEGPKQQTRGSQITKLSSLDLFENGKAITEKAQKEYERNKELLTKMHKNAYNNLLEELGIEDLDGEFKLIDAVSASQALKRQLLTREVSENVKDILEVDKQTGEFKIPFEASTHYIQIRDILFSMVDKALVSPKMNGGAHVQVPVTMWESSKKGRRVSEINGKKVFTDDTLKFYTKEQPYCEIMIPCWFRDDLKRSSKFKNKSDEEIIKYLNNTGILNGIGFRIPTQSQSSIEVFKVKGFLPDFMGKTVVVPSEITTKAGSDFDIDKLNMYLKSVYVDQNGDIKLVKLTGTEEETKEYYSKIFDKKSEGKQFFKSEVLEALQIYKEEMDDPKNLVEKYANTLNTIISETDDIYAAQEKLMSEIEQLSDEDFQKSEKQKFVNKMYKQALENEYYDSLEKLMTLPEMFDRLISPVSDAGLKKVSDNLDKLRNEDETSIKNRILNRNYMTKLRHAFLTGKKWVGIAAVNITGQALTQKSQIFIDPSKFALIPENDKKILGDGKVILPHNQIDGNISISGIKTADGKQYISERLSGYATSFVDIAKDPYILKIIKSDLAVGTFMFLERIGVGENIAYFMNQPIISAYLEYLDSINYKNLYSQKHIKTIKGKFITSDKQLEKAEINTEELKNNIEKYYKKGQFESDIDNAIQHKILDEFLKYAKMAEYSFKLTQASNYDTASFRSSNSLFRKLTRTQIARERNIFNSVDKLLENSFIGDQMYLLSYTSEAVGEILKLDSYKYRQILNEVLKPYAEREFFSDEKYEKVGNKLLSSFLDYIIQTKQGINSSIDELLVNTSTSVASKLVIAKKKYPGLKILEDLEPVSSGRTDGVTSIKLRVNLKEAYDENLYTDYMRELKVVDEQLYKDIVTLAILQGTYQSAISIKNIIPTEDYSKIVAPIIQELTIDADIEAFTNGAFQRNNWKDEDIFRTVEPKFFTSEGSLSIDQFGNEIYSYFSPAFPNIEKLGFKSKDRRILILGEKYNFLDVQNDYLLVPRVVTDSKTKEQVDIVTGLGVTKADFAKRKTKGDMSLKDVFGYKKVKLEDGTPLTRVTKDGTTEYVYKLINLWGDGQYASEYYTSPKPSVLNNGTVKITNEIPDADIINYFAPQLQKVQKTETQAEDNENIPPCI